MHTSSLPGVIVCVSFLQVMRQIQDRHIGGSNMEGLAGKLYIPLWGDLTARR